MMEWHEKAGEIVEKAVELYEMVFKTDFPLFAYLKPENGVVTEKVANELKKLIEKHIQEKKPVLTPDGYWDCVF